MEDGFLCPGRWALGGAMECGFVCLSEWTLGGAMEALAKDERWIVLENHDGKACEAPYVHI